MKPHDRSLLAWPGDGRTSWQHVEARLVHLRVVPCWTGGGLGRNGVSRSYD